MISQSTISQPQSGMGNWKRSHIAVAFTVFVLSFASIQRFSTSLFQSEIRINAAFGITSKHGEQEIGPVNYFPPSDTIYRHLASMSF